MRVIAKKVAAGKKAIMRGQKEDWVQEYFHLSGIKMMLRSGFVTSSCTDNPVAQEMYVIKKTFDEPKSKYETAVLQHTAT